MVIIIHAGSALYHSCPLYEPAFVPLCFISTAARGSVPVFFMLTLEMYYLPKFRQL